MAYVTNVLFVHHPPDKLGKRTSREVTTMALALDSLLQGRLAQCGDVLMQRMKALEQSIVSGSWDVAKNLEVIPPSEPMLVNTTEMRMAASAELRAQKLRSLLKDAKQKHD